MPAWLISIIINVALRLGLLGLARLFPGLPQGVREIIEELIAALQSGVNKDHAVTQAKVKIKKVCQGDKCATK